MEVLGFNGNEWDLMDINWDLMEFSQKEWIWSYYPAGNLGKCAMEIAILDR
jgi:hypothetical protein